MHQAKELAAALASTAAGPVRVFRAPGRVNLIGEHAEDGFALPLAIGFDVWIAAAPRTDRVLAVRSENFSEARSFALDEADVLAAGPSQHWSDHVRGVAAVLEASGHRIPGADLLIRGRVPIGAGLGSSSALRMATAVALTALGGLPVDRHALARACQEAAGRFAGTRGSLLDACAVAHGRAGHALLLDLRSLEVRPVPLPPGVQVVVCNSLVRRDCAGSEASVRRAECEAGLRHVGRAGVTALRDASLADFEGGELTSGIRRRCRHVIRENAWAREAAAALEAGDAIACGGLLDRSHASLRDDYEVSCPEVDALVALARGIDGVLGARMTGPGFGGCTVNLVRAEHVDEFRGIVSAGYRQVTGRTPEVFVCPAADGAGEVVD